MFLDYFCVVHQKYWRRTIEVKDPSVEYCTLPVLRNRGSRAK